MVRVVLNGEERTFVERPTIVDLLRELGVSPAIVAVEVNETIVPRASHSERLVEDGDRIEVVTFVGGG